jgi:hypothetical protein
LRHRHKGIYRFFCRHYGKWFCVLKERYTSHHLRARQAANLWWKVKERLWQEFLAFVPHDPSFAICVLDALAGVPLRSRLSLCKRFPVGRPLLAKTRCSQAELL